jgi:hypothetical protein
MAAILLNGQRVTSLTVTIPYYGPWSADVTMASGDEILDSARKATTSVTLTIGDLTLKGTILRQAAYGAARSLRIVGGAAGWRKVIPSKGYSQPTGISLSTVLGDAAKEVGESIVVGTDRAIGAAWAREEAKAERTLALLTAGEWWIDTAGVTQLKARDESAIATPFTVSSRLGGKGQFEIATDLLASWQPGRKFSAPTVTDQQTISSVTIDASNDGKLRLLVLAKSDTTERLLTSLRSLIRAEIASLSYQGVWEYTIASGSSTTVDVTSSDPRMPDLSAVPMMAGLMGEVVTPTPGSKCRITFVNGDPTRPECISIEGESLKTTFGATTNIEANPGVMFKVGNGLDFAAHALKVDLNFAALIAMFNAHIHPTGVGPTLPPIVPAVPAVPTQCLKLKTD